MVYLSWIVGAGVSSVTVRQSLVIPLPNGRDLGGTPLRNGRVVAHNRLLRSASPADASAAVVDELIHTHGLRTVIDLRSQRECDKDEGTCLLHTAHGAPSLQLLPMLDEQMLRDGLKRKLLRPGGVNRVLQLVLDLSQSGHLCKHQVASAYVLRARSPRWWNGWTSGANAACQSDCR